MLEVFDSDIIEQTDIVVSAMKKSKIGVISGDAFQRKAFPVLERQVNRKYPYEVRIPKSIPEMLNTNDPNRFEPAKVINVTKPIEGPYSNVWFGDASSGIKMLCGYINGDSRYIFDTELGDAVVHGIMVGSTGQGKSVTLNSIIYNACAMYAPWEMHMTLSDAKIVEFKSIAENNPMPNIEIVAATGDTNYLLSVLQTKVQEMNMVNSVFTSAAAFFGKPIKKLEEFRKVTGLMLPQNLLIFDEFQAMFQKAKKLSPTILSCIDAIVRLGRNTGYHLLLTSQELGKDIPAQTMSNITFRGAMGCYPSISEQILNNDKAALNLGKKGHMIVNLNSERKPNEDANIDIRVPYIDPQTGEIAKCLIKLGNEFGVTPALKFYDEFKVEQQGGFIKALEQLPEDPKMIYLGEPAFVKEGTVNRLTMNLHTKEYKNIMVVAPVQSDLMRHFIMLKANALRYKENANMVLCSNSAFADDYGARELSEQLFFEDKDYKTSQTFAVVRSLIYRRMLCLEADKMAFDPDCGDVDLEESNKLFYMIVEKGSEFDNATNQIRFFFMKNLINANEIIKSGFGDMDEQGKLNVLRSTLETYKAYNALNSCLTLDRVPDLNVWLLGLDRLLGIGLIPKSSNLSSLRLLMVHGKDTNVRFTMFVNTLDELGDLNDVIRWYIFDNPITRDLNKAKVSDSYPEQVGASLAVYTDKMEPAQGCLKFKKLFFEGEIPVG